MEDRIMEYKKPEELLPSYMGYLFIGTIAWMYYQKGLFSFDKGVQGLRKAYRMDQLVRAMMYVEKKEESAKERYEYQKETERVIRERIESDENVMRQIAKTFQDLDLGVPECLKTIAYSFGDEVKGTELGDVVARYKYCLEGTFPNGKEFSDNMKEVVETSIKPQIETELSSMCRFICDYVDGMEVDQRMRTNE